MNYIFKKDDKNQFDKFWQDYFDKNKLGFEYALETMDYHLSCMDDLLEDNSFVVEQDGSCMGVCFLPLRVSVGYVIAPHAISDKVEKKIFTQTEAICKKLGIKELKFSLSVFDEHRFNKLLSYGFIDTSSTTCSINLDNEQHVLWKNLRKSYKSLVNGFIKDKAYSIIDSSSNHKRKLHDIYVSFHQQHMINERKKPKESFVYEKQYDMLESELASIIAIKYNEKIIFTNYFFHCNQKVVYASSAYDTDEQFVSKPLNHYLLWEAILYFKKYDFKVFNFGTPCGFNIINGFEDYLDIKQIDISHFKRGMGAEMKTQYQGVKIMDREILLQKIENFRSMVKEDE